MAMILTMLKRNREKDAHVKGGGWKHESLSGIYLGRRDEDGYAGLTVGIVGLGRIGGRMVELLKPWDVRLIVCDPFVEEEKFARYGVEKVDLDTLLRESDIVSLHPTLNPTSRGMMGADQFRAMKKTALFVNTSRGGTQDEIALADAIEAGEIAGAALDVFLDEPMDRDFQTAPDRERGAAVAPHDFAQPGRRARPRNRMGGRGGAHRAQGRGAGKRLQPRRDPPLARALRRQRADRLRYALR